MVESIWLWVGFLAFVFAMLAIDLGVFRRGSTTVALREATIWVVVWISLALFFALGLYFFWKEVAPSSDLTNGEAALTFLTAYIIEYSLSVDNIFIFVLLFSFFAVKPEYQHRVLFWGILGALLMRGVMIVAGAALIERFHWILYIFGAFLVYTGVRLALPDDDEIDPENNVLLRFARRIFPVTHGYREEKFFVVENGIRMATPLFLVLLVVESTDLIFALDSIPAIFAITTDSFIAFTSNIFAILGLRSLYFLLSGIMGKFHYLKLGLAIILTFVGVKMLAEIIHIEVPILLSLLVIVLVLSGSIFASLLWPPKAHADQIVTEGERS